MPYESSGLKPTAVLVHGCHVNAIGWKEIVYGNLDGRLGRVPTALEEAVNKQASLIFWGTGASEKKGSKESEYTYQKAIGSKLAGLAAVVGKDQEDLRRYVTKVSYVDKKTQNTAEEIGLAIKKCKKRGIEELILVSSPTHIARCLQEACKIQDQMPDLAIKFYALPSKIGFFKLTDEGKKEELSPASVTIVEPPHRGDMPKIFFNDTVRDIFGLLKSEEVARDFNEEFKKLIEVYKKKL